MCRFMIYKGESTCMADLLTKPAHSIIRQSYDCKERSESYVTPPSLNADGFGVSWYLDPDASDNTPGVFVSVEPAWSSLNLAKLSPKIYSPLMFAHVRAASAPPVSEINCHPFVQGLYTFMHNGGIGDFRSLKRQLERHVSDALYVNIRGTTDSELAFALFLNEMTKLIPGFDPETSFSPPELMAQGVVSAIRVITETTARLGTKPSLLNFAVTDGRTVIVSRYTDHPDNPGASLYFSSGSTFSANDDGHYSMRRFDKREEVVIVSSEPLTNHQSDWVTVPRNHLVSISPHQEVSLLNIDHALAKSLSESQE